MRYSITKALVYLLMKDAYFMKLKESDREYITNIILNDVKGRMLEDIVLFETRNKLKNSTIFKYQSITRGEYDMVNYNKDSHTCSLYEIKHSAKISFDNQSKFLRNEELLAVVKKQVGDIDDKYVLYRGEDKDIEDIKYRNVEQYLTQLNKNL